MKKQYLFLSIIFFLTFIFRFPSLFEPFWYGDEGIFAAVARNLNFGGVLYQDAWDNKPPMIYLTYQAIFNFFGVSMFWLRMIAAIFVMATCAAIYEIAQTVLGSKRALIAALAFGFLSSLRVIEGNLALTEIFMLLPITLAILIAIKRNFDFASLFVSGVLFAVASLYKQVGAFEAAALGIFLFLFTPKFSAFVKRGIVLSIGFAFPYFLTVLYFAPKGLLGDYIFAAYTYYQIYLEESPQRAILINVLKVLPIVCAIVYGFWKKRAGKIDVFHLFLLWCAFSFLGSYFSGRTYGHYLVQATPAVSLLLASVNISAKLTKASVIFALCFFVPIFVLTKILFNEFFVNAHVNQTSYFRNFIEFTSGKKNVDEYNSYFDGNVNNIMSLADFFGVSGTRGSSVYIWGDYPWLYAISDLANPSRYVTSFHVFGVPNGPEEVAGDLTSKMPDFVIKSAHSIGYFERLEKLLSENYTLRSKIGNSDVYVRRTM